MPAQTWRTASSVQRVPPSTRNGRSAASSSSTSRSISGRPGLVSTATKGRGVGASTASVSISSGRTTTTGPGRPEVATAKARVTSSGTRAASSICTTHFAIVPKKAL
jgi:hypothetical protein